MKNNATNKHCLKCCIIGKKATTLIEILIVIAIMAIVGGAITGRMLSGIERARLQAAGRQLVSHIRLAQERAKLEQRNYTVEFSAINETYAVYQAGLSFNGVNNWVRGTGRATNVQDNFTLEAWINPAALPQGPSLVVYNGDDPGGYGFGIGSGVGGSGSRLQGLFGGVTWIDSGYTFPSANQWYHVVMTRNLGITRFHVNASQTSGTTTATPNVPNNFLTIGCQINPLGNPHRHFNGRISEVRIYNRALTPGEISYSFTYKKPQNRAGLVGWWKLDEGGGAMVADLSRNSNTGTISGATWTQGILSYLKDPAKGHRDINYNFNNLDEFRGVTIYSVDF